MKDYFTYYDGKDICGDKFRIGASQISKFFDFTNAWYRENLLHETGFEGSTASELGNCVHAAAHMYFDNQEVDYEAITDYINSITNPEVDKTEILRQYPGMVDLLISSFPITSATDAELFIFEETLPGIGVGGSIDLYDKSVPGGRATIYDYKTTGSLDRVRIPTKFPRAYWFQQLAYAWVLRKQGKPVDYLKLVYVTRSNTGRVSEKTGKPMKDYPSELHILTEPVTDESLDLIGSVIQLMSESVDTWNKHPELRHILAQDQRLKIKPKLELFI